MRQKLQLGSTPIDENCAGVESPDYAKNVKIECMAFIKQLKRMFNRKPAGIVFRIDTYQYEAPTVHFPNGIYITEVVAWYDDMREDHKLVINRIESKIPEVWDTAALTELKNSSIYSKPLALRVKEENNEELRKAIDLIEEAGGFVMISEKDPGFEEMKELLVEEKIGEDGMAEFNTPKEKNPTEISIEEVAANYGYNDSMEMVQNYALSSVVPACCNEGCEVEPDGTCQHGNESILLNLGVI